MNDFILKTNYNLEIISNNEDFYDFHIIKDSNIIGILQLKIYDEIFIRNIEIFKEFRRNGHAKYIVDYLLYFYKKPVSLCISMHSESAIHFWKNYLSKKEKVINERGNIFKIYQK